MGSSSSANLTTKQNIAARTTPQNLPNSSSLYYRTFESNSSEKHAYVSSVNNTTGEVTIGWTPSQDTVAGRHGVYFVLGQQAGGGGGAQTVTATSIASAEAFGSPTLTPGAVTVTATGIASVEAFGTATVQAGAVTVTATAIGSGEAFGSPEAQPGTVSFTPPGFDGSALGYPNFFGQVGILAQQIFSAEAFGTPTLSGSAAQISPTGILTAEAFGTAAVTTVAATVTPDGVLSQEAFGTLTLQPGLATVSPQAILSAEALGTPQMRVPGMDSIIWDSAPKIAVQARGRLNVAQAAALPVVQQAMVWRSRP